ncbi:hypothetical protein AVEN_172571-1 [Araneus ventricosus]|uniref:Uncharacterized protein n=1 Tax=Araneus ventricosus TaxID=182803 RepID=A0A4Y2PCL2_ARAVE|nr:hypothetical protein AVEN_172571-1 [Araneus ventricosus]
MEEIESFALITLFSDKLQNAIEAGVWRVAAFRGSVCGIRSRSSLAVICVLQTATGFGAGKILIPKDPSSWKIEETHSALSTWVHSLFQGGSCVKNYPASKYLDD